MQFQISPLKNPWLALRAAAQKAAREGDRIAEKSILERFYALARTYFEEKCWQMQTGADLRPLRPTQKHFDYFFVSPAWISFLKAEKCFLGGSVVTSDDVTL